MISIKLNTFFYPYFLAYVVGTQKNGVNEMLF